MPSELPSLTRPDTGFVLVELLVALILLMLTSSGLCIVLLSSEIALRRAEAGAEVDWRRSVVYQERLNTLACSTGDLGLLPLELPAEASRATLVLTLDCSR